MGGFDGDELEVFEIEWDSDRDRFNRIFHSAIATNFRHSGIAIWWGVIRWQFKMPGTSILKACK
jgi:hypothetical protein